MDRFHMRKLEQTRLHGRQFGEYDAEGNRRTICGPEFFGLPSGAARDRTSRAASRNREQLESISCCGVAPAFDQFVRRTAARDRQPLERTHRSAHHNVGRRKCPQ